MYSDTNEDMRTQLYLSAFIPDIENSSYNENFKLKLYIDEVPQEFTFNKGNKSANRVILESEDFGDIWMTPKKDFSGLVRLNITAEATTPRETKIASSQIEIKIKAVADIPFLNVSVPCYHWNSSEKIIPVSLESHLNDRDGSENLTIIFSGLPSDYRSFYENVTKFVNGSNDTAPHNSPSWFISFNGTLRPFVLSVIAIATERTNGDKANRTVAVDVAFCGKFHDIGVLIAEKCFRMSLSTVIIYFQFNKMFLNKGKTEVFSCLPAVSCFYALAAGFRVFPRFPLVTAFSRVCRPVKCFYFEFSDWFIDTDWHCVNFGCSLTKTLVVDSLQDREDSHRLADQ